MPRSAAILFHGAGGGGWEWNIWRRVLVAGGFDVAAPDLQPAAGGLAATGWDDYLGQALQVAQPAATHGPPLLVGASLGGLLALAVSAQVRCLGLVLVNPLPPLPEALSLPPRPATGPVIPWRSRARLASTRRALFDADDAACLYAFRRWRDESARVLAQAQAGIALSCPSCPVLVIASEADIEVPISGSIALATRLDASLARVPGSHVGALLGRRAAAAAGVTLSWLSERL
jgi:pimeloyl-ACP methyl ester carboxylesterase